MSHQRPALRVHGSNDHSIDGAPQQPSTHLAVATPDERRPLPDPPRPDAGWGTAFFGWLAANGLMVLLIALVAASGTALDLTRPSGTSLTDSAATIGVSGAVALLVVVTLSFLAGGYVAGRMSGSRGAVHGFGVWLFGAAVALVLAVVGVLYGSRYDVQALLGLPRIPLDQGMVTQAAGVALAVIAVTSLLAAVIGGRLGERTHRRMHGW
jgi:hypothetical protein